MSSDLENRCTMYFCPVCNIRYELVSDKDRQFYWSYGNTATTADQVANKVCSYLKDAKKIEMCVNQSNVETWGREFKDEFFKK